MDITGLSVGCFGANCYLLNNGDDALMIDPGGDAKELVQLLNKKQLSLRAILLTHGHFDHIGAVPDLARKYDVPVVLAEADQALYHSPANCFPPFPCVPDLPETTPDVPVIEGLECDVIATPGHSQGSVCYRFGGHLFTGDTLFRLSVGRTDLPGGDGRQLMKSIRERLWVLGDDVQVYPGHGEPTTIGHERQHNPYLQGGVW